jgi:hypothetical protein
MLVLVLAIPVPIPGMLRARVAIPLLIDQKPSRLRAFIARLQNAEKAVAGRP